MTTRLYGVTTEGWGEAGKDPSGHLPKILDSLRLLVADDHALVRDSLAHHLSRLGPQVEICGVESAHMALKKIADEDPFDLILFDLVMPGPPWRSSLRKLRSLAPQVPVIAIGESDARRDIEDAAALGVAGFVSKAGSTQMLIGAVRLVLQGERFIPSGDGPPPPRSAPSPWRGKLTRRQAQIIKLLAQGLANKEIARELNLSEGTVKIHVTTLIRLFAARNRTQVVLAAQDAGLV